MRDPNTYEETERIIASENYRKIVKSLEDKFVTSS